MNPCILNVRRGSFLFNQKLIYAFIVQLNLCAFKWNDLELSVRSVSPSLASDVLTLLVDNLILTEDLF